MSVVPYNSADRMLILGSVAGPVLAFAAMALAPPAHGAMLLVPWHAGVSPVRVAFDLATPVLGRGPGGTVIVYGDRAALAAPALRAGLVPLAAPAALCGAVPS